jgi:hypothetical protein
MKTLIVLCVVLMSGCVLRWSDANSPAQRAKVKNYTTCSNDEGCRDDQHCGFVCVDCVPVCLDGAPGKRF